jgi:hypothetical protein
MSSSSYSEIDLANLQQVTSYSTLLLQTDLTNNIYYLNESDISSGYVFEITDFDKSVSLTVDPTFDTRIQQDLALADVSAIAVLDVSLSDFNTLFSFQSDSDDLDDLSVNDLKFGINTSSSTVFSNLLYSHGTVVEQKINSYYSEQFIYNDFVRNIAYQITGGYSASDIFSNEENLLQGVKDLDSTFQSLFTTILTDVITDTTTNGFRDVHEIKDLTQDASLYKAAIALFTINSNSGPASERLTDLFDDIKTASDAATVSTANVGPITVPLRFYSGDKIALRLEYKNQDTNPIGNNILVPRSYKLLLNLV